LRSTNPPGLPRPPASLRVHQAEMERNKAGKKRVLHPGRAGWDGANKRGKLTKVQALEQFAVEGLRPWLPEHGSAARRTPVNDSGYLYVVWMSAEERGNAGYAARPQKGGRHDQVSRRPAVAAPTLSPPDPGRPSRTAGWRRMRHG
jgi:hypothetical protein